MCADFVFAGEHQHCLVIMTANDKNMDGMGTRSSKRGVCLNTASKRELLTVTVITADDVDRIIQLRGDDGVLERQTLFAEISLSPEKLDELVKKGVVQVVFKDDFAEGEDEHGGNSMNDSEQNKQTAEQNLAAILLTLQSGQEQIKLAIQQGNANQAELGRRVKEVEIRQGTLALEHRKLQDEQTERFEQLVRRMESLESGRLSGGKLDARGMSLSDHVKSKVEVSGQEREPRKVSTPAEELGENSSACDDFPFDRRQFDEPSTPMTYFFHPEAGLQPVTRPGVNPDRKLSDAEHMQARRGTQSRQQARQLDVNRVHRKIQSVNSVGSTTSKRRSPKQGMLNESHLTSSDSDSDASEPEVLHRRHKAPSLPKMQTFDGKSSDWAPFIFQFRKMAKAGHWTEREKKDGLLACLRGKAITYVQSKPRGERSSYKALRDLLAQGYGVMELPSTARRQLSAMRQEEGESLEDFADRIMLKAGEGFHGVPEDTLQSLATDAYLKGCRDRNAAYAAAERKPETLQQAVVDMRDAAANLRTFSRATVSARQVTFATDSEDEGRGRSESRRSQRESLDSKLLSEEQMALIQFMMERFTKDREGRAHSPASRGRSSFSGLSSRARSPSPAKGSTNGECYHCGQVGHFAKDCRVGPLCYNCNKRGHMSAECRSKSSGEQGKTSRSVSPASSSVSEDLNSQGVVNQAD